MQELTLRQFTEVAGSDPRIAKRLEASWSPGPVASRLGITRQGVHKLLNLGRLQGVRLVHKDGSLAAILVFEDSITRYERERATRAAS